MRRDTVFQYVVALIIACVLVGVLYWFELYTSGEGGLGALNVSLAAGTLFLLGSVLLLGPLSRLFSVFDTVFKFRKELGIVSFFTASAHVYISMFAASRNGPWGLYLSRPLSAYPGLEALGILFFLFILSNSVSTRALGTRIWWKLQYWGVRLAFALIAFHMIALKYKTIVSWQWETYPPLIIWETQFVVLILVIRLSELFGRKWARSITQISCLFVTGVIIRSLFLR